MKRWHGMALAVLVATVNTRAAEPVPDRSYAAMTPTIFDVHYADMDDRDVPVIRPWKTIVLDAEFRGSWVVTGDLTGDGRREIVCARSVGGGDARYTSAVAAHDLDGNVLWRWGDATIGSGRTGFDVACQIHDTDQDGRNEVVLTGERHVIILNGETGEELRRFEVPVHASDSIVFCDLQGRGYPADILVKNRYKQIWAYGPDGKLLWTSEHPGGYCTAHQPRPIDVSRDGKHEIMAGYAMLNPDGTQRWVLDATVPFARGTDLGGGHLDCARVLRDGDTPEEMRLVLTFCGGNRIAKVDGNGKFFWRVAGAHFESAQVGNIMPDVPGRQILVDIDHQPFGKSPLVVFGEDGTLLGRFMLERSRHHLLIDWTGDGVDSIVVSQMRCMFDGRGNKTAIFDIPTPEGEKAIESRALISAKADMTGDNVPDLLLWDNPGTRVYIYKNEKGTKSPAASSGSNNATFY